MTQPLVSVVLPAYNAQEFVKTSIESILNQSYSNIEVIIIEDCSTDNTLAVITAFADARIKLVRNRSNLKLVESLNLGFSLSLGKYIARMDADDIASPKRIEKQVEFMENNHDVALLGTAFQAFGDEDKMVSYESEHDSIRWKQLFECHILHPSVMIRKSVLEKEKYRYDSTYLHCEDYELWARISLKYKLANLHEILMKYRVWGGNVTHTYKSVQDDHSRTVQEFLFSRLGLNNTSNRDLELFRNLNYHIYPTDRSSLYDVGNLLKRIYDANNKSHYFPNSFCKSKLGSLWFHCCYSQRKNGLYVYRQYKSISVYMPTNKFNKVKLFLRCLIRH